MPDNYQPRDSMRSPRFSQPATFMRLPYVRALKGVDVVGFDLVEVTPLYDGPGQVTSLLAANLVFEFLSSR